MFMKNTVIELLAFFVGNFYCVRVSVISCIFSHLFKTYGFSCFGTALWYKRRICDMKKRSTALEEDLSVMHYEPLLFVSVCFPDHL